MRQPKRLTPSQQVTFDRKIGLFKAQDHAASTCIALGRTPDEALAILQRVRSRFLELTKQAKIPE